MLNSLTSLVPGPAREPLRRLRASTLSLSLPRSDRYEIGPKALEATRRLSIIVPIHDSPEVVLRCLESLELYAGEAQIILVDDGSRQPETMQVIEAYQHKPGWIALRNDQPKGHSRACEAGAKVADRPILCLLNSDTLVTPDSWEATMEPFESDPQVAVTGPTTSWAATVQADRRARSCRNYWSLSQICAFAQHNRSRYAGRTAIILPEVSGFAMFVRRDLWEKEGGFDPSLDDYGNESEFCLRISRKGYRILWTPEAYIHHLGQQSYTPRLGSDQIIARARAARAYIDRRYASPHESTP